MSPAGEVAAMIAERIGVRAPILIRPISRVEAALVERRMKKRPLGLYTGTDADGRHVLAINPAQSTLGALSTIAHELTHARQAEREGGVARLRALYAAANRVYGYERNPYEVEARETAERVLASLSDEDAIWCFERLGGDR